MKKSKKIGHLGTFLKELREELKLSLSDVEKRSLSMELSDFVTSDYISKVENGKIQPKLAKLLVFSRVYGVDVEEFIEKTNLDLSSRPMPQLPDDSREALKMGQDEINAGNYRRARPYLEKAAEFCRAADNEDEKEYLLAVAFARLGLCYFKLGHLRTAQNLVRKALKLQDFRNSADVALPAMKLLGDIMRSMEEYNLAGVFLEKGLELSEKNKNDSLTAGFYNSLGNLHMVKKDFDRASRYYEKAMNIYDFLGRGRKTSFAGANLGLCLIRKGRVDEGIKHVSESRDQLSAVNCGSLQMARILLMLVEAHYVNNDYDKALKYGDEALELVKEKDHLDIRFQCLYYRWRISEKTGDDEDSRLNLRKLKLLRGRITRNFEELKEFNRLIRKKADE